MLKLNLPLNIKYLIENEHYDEAQKVLLLLAERGNSDAQHVLGYLYFTNADVNAGTSAEWLWKAAQQGNAEAYFELSTLPIGEHSPIVPNSATRSAFLVDAAALGCSAALRTLGIYYALGENSFSKDAEKARILLQRAAAQNHVEAKYDLAMMLLNGEGGITDNAGAIQLLREILHADHYEYVAEQAYLVITEMILVDVELSSLIVNEIERNVQYWQDQLLRLQGLSKRHHPYWFYGQWNRDP